MNSSELDPLWLLAASKEGILSADEAAAWPKGVFEACIEAGLIAPIQAARSIACDACDEGHVEKVIPRGGQDKTRFYITCPDSGLIEVESERLRQWRFDGEALARWLADKLDEARGMPRDAGEGAWLLGKLRCGTRSFEVYLATTQRGFARLKESDRADLSLVMVPNPLTDSELDAQRWLVTLNETVEWRRGELRFLSKALEASAEARETERIDPQIHTTKPSACGCGAGLHQFVVFKELNESIQVSRSTLTKHDSQLRAAGLVRGDAYQKRYAVCTACGAAIYHQRGYFTRCNLVKKKS